MKFTTYFGTQEVFSQEISTYKERTVERFVTRKNTKYVLLSLSTVGSSTNL